VTDKERDRVRDIVTAKKNEVRVRLRKQSSYEPQLPSFPIKQKETQVFRICRIGPGVLKKM
jgi:hypothetical protein